MGKTTTAATLAIEGARRGRDSVVVTIDPAKRLANTLGLEHLSNSAARDPARHLGSRPGRHSGWASARADARHRDHVRPAHPDLRARRRAGATHPREPLLPQHRRRALGHAGVHGDGEAVRAPRPRRVRPHRRRHAADPSRARLPRRAPPAHPDARQPGLPASSWCRPVPRCGWAPSRPRRSSAPSRVSSARSRSTTSSPSSARSKGWKKASATGPRQVMQLLAADETAFVLSRRRGGTRWKRRSTSPQRLADGEFAVDALVVNRVHGQYSGDGAGRAARHARSSSAREPGDAAARPRSCATRTSPNSRTSRAGNGASSPGSRSGSATRRWRTCPSSATTCTTSPRSGQLPTICWPRAEPAAETVATSGDGVADG